MRYIGNKENIVDKIHSILVANRVEGKTFFDLFAGTTGVSRYYKQLGYTVFSSDIMYMSYCLQKAYIENNDTPLFNDLLPIINKEVLSPSLFYTPLELVLSHLDSIEPKQGFIYKNYTPDGTCHLESPRLYFTGDNGAKIDAIRIQIEEWKDSNIINENEYYILLSCLLESVSFYANIAGVYAAFYKKWDPRAIKPLKLRPIAIVNNNQENKSYNADSLSLVDAIDTDILYLDPPYNERQYLPNYHILETIAKYDNPQIKGITGIRYYDKEKSVFCNAKSALTALKNIAENAKYKFLVLSYNSEGIMKQADIIALLSQYGQVTVEQFEYNRFKSNNNGLSRTKKTVFEQLYILKK